MAQRSIEWQTVIVAVAIAAGLGATIAAHDRVPTVVTLTALALLGAWYNSLQHEVVHGHPTPWRRFNTLFAIAPLGLVVPFSVYRHTHLAHHRTPNLTDPDADPESFYVDAATWERAGSLHRAVLVALRTLSGRLVLGPLVSCFRWWRHIAPSGRSQPGRRTVAWHAVGVTIVLLAVRATGMPVWMYLVGFAWGGASLSLLRSFAEHRVPEGGTRSAVVRSNWFFSLLFLNNNLHHTHHARPRSPWYAIPALHEQLGSDDIAARGAGLYNGYGEIARRYLVRPFDHPVAPSHRGVADVATSP